MLKKLSTVHSSCNYFFMYGYPSIQEKFPARYNSFKFIGKKINIVGTNSSDIEE